MLANYSFLLCLFISSYDQLWLEPEMEELCIAFNKLKNLSVCGIFVEFDILWTTAFLVAAPSIKRLCIQVISLSYFFTCGALGSFSGKINFVPIAHNELFT